MTKVLFSLSAILCGFSGWTEGRLSGPPARELAENLSSLNYLKHGINLWSEWPLGEPIQGGAESARSGRNLQGAQGIFDFSGLPTEEISAVDLGGTEAGKVFLVPASMVIPSLSCSLSLSTQTVTSSNDFFTKIGGSVSANNGEGFYGVKFSATASYENMVKTSQKSDTQFAVSRVKCLKFRARNDAQASTFTPQFKDDVARLSKKTIAAFINKYGTHFITEAVFGGTFSSLASVSSSDVEKILEAKQSVSSTMEATFLGVTVGAKGNYDKEQKSFSKLGLTSVQLSQSTLGGRVTMNEDGRFDLTKWQNEGLQPETAQPMADVSHPVKVASIGSLLTEGNFPGDPDIESKSLIFDDYVGSSQWCDSRGVDCQANIAQGCPIPPHVNDNGFRDLLRKEYSRVNSQLCHNKQSKTSPYSDYSCATPAHAAQLCTKGTLLNPGQSPHLQPGQISVKVTSQRGALFFQTNLARGASQGAPYDINVIKRDGKLLPNGWEGTLMCESTWGYSQGCIFYEFPDLEDQPLEQFCAAQGQFANPDAAGEACWSPDSVNQDECGRLGDVVRRATDCCDGFAQRIETSSKGRFRCSPGNFATKVEDMTPKDGKDLKLEWKPHSTGLFFNFTGLKYDVFTVLEGQTLLEKVALGMAQLHCMDNKVPCFYIPYSK